MTYAARHALVHADVVIGYQTYIDQIRPLLSPHQEVIARPMQSELSRAQQALERATQGQRVVLVSSGDIGMYAMAGPVFELLHQQPPTAPVPEVTVLPGVSAFQAAAARVGAAINHDLCTISLSDLLTPWAVIVQRLHAAASGDFVVALYNPRSKGRTDHLAQALDVLRQHRPPTTPVLFARNVSRPDEQLHRTTLAEADPTIVDMLTVVLIGNRQSYWSGDLFITPRGYLAPPPTPEPDPQSNVAPNTPIHPDHPPHPTYPIVLTQMQGVPVLVVGGGAVAERKVRGLREVGAAITVISPTLTPQLAAWVDATEITWLPRRYVPKDVTSTTAVRPTLVIAATNEPDTNRAIAADAAAQGVLCNVATDPTLGTVHLPAVYRHNELVVAVSTAGTDPAQARDVRDRLAAFWQQEGKRE